MLKFLRKYNKIILVFGGVLLMVAFLAPQGIQQFGQLQNRAVATMDGRTVKEKELLASQAQFNAVNALGGFGFGLASTLLGLGGESNDDAALHWFLLAKEAEEAGLIGSDLDGRSYYPSLAQQAAQLVAIQQVRNDPRLAGLPAQTREQLARFQALQLTQQYTPEVLRNIEQTEQAAASVGRFKSIEELHRAVATLRGIQRLQSSFLTIPRLSEPRLKAQAVRLRGALTADLIEIQADRFLASTAQPTEEQIQAHFQARRETNPADDEFAMGYLQPQRLKLEWLELNRADFEPVVQVSAVDQRKHWELNRTTYPGEFSEERERVRLDLIAARVNRLLEDAERIVRGEVLRSTRELERAGDFLVLPENWRETALPLEAIAQTVVDRLRESESIQIPLPRVVRLESQWQTQQDLLQHPSFAGATVRIGSGQAPAGQALFLVRELNPNPLISTQVGTLQAEHPAVAPDGSRRLVRVLDSRPVSAPDSIEEVRQQVNDDWRLLRAYETMNAELDGYFEVASAAGLDAMAEAMNAGLPEASPERIAVQRDVRLTSVPTQGMPPSVARPEILDEIFAVAGPLDPTIDHSGTPTQGRAFLVRHPALRVAVVGTIDRLEPLTIENYRFQAQSLEGESVNRELQAATDAQRPFTLDSLKARHGWTPRRAAPSPAAPQQPGS